MTKAAPIATLQGLPQGTKAAALALSVLVERIGSLPKDDRDDLFILMQELRRHNSPAEQAEIIQSMEEILVQSPVTIKDDLLIDKPENKSKKWKEFVSNKIKTLRDKIGMTQGELATKSGLHQSHISRLEDAKYSATNKTLQKIALALGVPMSELDPSES